MLRCGKQIRLTGKEEKSLVRLTDDIPDVKTVEALNGFVDLHLGKYPGRFPEEKLLRHLLESEKIKD